MGKPDWPTFTWDEQGLAKPLAYVSREQGRLLGKMEALGLDPRNEAHLCILTEDVIKSSKIEDAQEILGALLGKAHFWERLAKEALNKRQIKVLNRLLGGFEGKLTTSNWAKIAKCSQDAAYRDILNLIDRGVLQKDSDGRRSTSYSLIIA